MLYYGLLVISLIILLVRRKLLDKHFVWLIPAIGLAILTQAVSDIINYQVAPAEKKYFLFHLYQPLEHCCLAMFYYHLFKRPWIKKFVLFSIPVFALFSVLYYFVFTGLFNKPDFKDFSVEAFFISTWAILFFIELFRDDRHFELVHYPAFWINVGHLFFYSGCLLVMGLNYYVESVDPVLAGQLLNINYYLNLLLYTLYIIAFTCMRPPIR